MGSQVMRKVRNKEYLYYVYYDDKERKEIYCGVASDPKSETKARMVEIEELEKRQSVIKHRLQILKDMKK